VVVVEDQLAVVDEDAAVLPRELVPLDVPRSEASARVLEHVDAGEPLGPVVEVLLVAHLAVLEAEVAPLQAAVAPPVERLEPALVAAEGHELDVVGAARLLVRLPLRRVAV